MRKLPSCSTRTSSLNPAFMGSFKPLKRIADPRVQKSMLQNSTKALRAQPATSRNRLMVVIVGMGALSVLAIASMLRLADRISSPVDGSVVIFLAALLVVPCTILFFLGIRQARASFREMRSSIRWWHWMLLLSYISQLVFRLRDGAEGKESPPDAL